ncbi:MAG: flagellar export chaperone FliS [Burkholderiales bacterium]|jgi:flagellar protein FliS|nr:flagellar export chaperone FliS [Burkholderiales bacterium]
MNPGMMFGAKAYAAVGLETDVATASPHELILLLYDGVLKCIRDARAALANQDIRLKCDHVSKAVRIIDEGLRSSIDTRVGGTLPDQLMSLYDYVSREMLLASLRNEDAKFAHCAEIMDELRQAWAGIPTGNNTSNSNAAPGYGAKSYSGSAMTY